jgi:hypothetical protein
MNPQPPPAAPAPAGSKFAISLADLLVAGGALVIFLFSFAPVVGFDSDANNNQIGRSLWSWLSPLGLFVIIAVLALIASAAVDTWWHKGKPITGGLHRHHLQVGLALFVLVTIFGMALADPYSDLTGGLSLGFGVAWGGIIQLLGALVVTGGAVLNYFDLLQNKLSLPTGGAKPAGYVPTQGAAVDPGATSAPDSTAQLPPQN